MNNTHNSKKPDTEPVVGSSIWGWVVFLAFTGAIVAGAYFFQP